MIANDRALLNAMGVGYSIPNELKIRQALATLNDRERAYLAQRFALNGGVATPASIVAQKLALSPRRVNQLERAALSKLRKAMRKK